MSDVLSQHAAAAPAAVSHHPAKLFLMHFAIIALGLVMIYPVLWMVSSSFKPAQLIFSEPGLLPRQMTLDNWAQGWVGLGIPFSIFFLNETKELDNDED